jgi:hypothetical protein
MEQNQMSKFCIELEGISMPDAIAAVVEAWYDAQNTLIISKPDSDSNQDVSIAELERRWGISRNALKARAKALGIELQRKGPTLTTWSGDRVADGDRLDVHCKAGGSLASFKVQKIPILSPANNLFPMADLAIRWGITSNTVSRRIAYLGIKPQRQGNFRYITNEQLAAGDELQSRVLSGKQPMGVPFDVFETMAIKESCDGKMLSELFETLPLSRGSIFEIIKALGIITTKGPGAGGKGRVAWVSNADGERLFDAAHRVNKGEIRIADLVPQKSDGIRLSEWQLSSGLSRSTLYEMLKILGIKPEGRRENGTRVLVSYLSAEQIQTLEYWSAAYKNNTTMPQIREAISKAQLFNTKSD